MADPKTQFRIRLTALVAATSLAGCSSSTYMHMLSVNPPDASVYVNGIRVGQGNSRPVEFDFTECPRISVQATHPDYQPEMEWFTLQKLKHMMGNNTPVTLTLRPRQ
jgi:hypothetical protein